MSQIMNITEVKEELLILYEKSLFFSDDYNYHPIRVIQAVKSIIGIDINRPICNLVYFCEEYVDRYDYNKIVDYKNANLELPIMMSYKNLEESLVNKDSEESYRNIYYLTTVSEGMQIVEFLLEYSLKYSKKSYLFIWSVYRMMLFTDKKFIFKSLLLCVDSIIKSKTEITFDEQNFNDEGCIIWEKIEKDKFELMAVIFSIYNSKLVRKETINHYISKILKNKKQKSIKDNVDLSDIDRGWIGSYFRGMLLGDIKVDKVLEYDAIRSIVKCTNDNHLNNFEIKRYIESKCN